LVREVNVIRQLVLNGDRIEIPAIWIACSTAIVTAVGIAVHAFGTSMFGRHSTSDIGPNWTTWFPVGALTLALAPLVFCETRKHVFLIMASLVMLGTLSILNLGMYFLRFWDD